MKAILYYVHDPMCSWCWGFSRTLTELLDNLPKEIEVTRLLGGLAPDSDIPMPEAMQQSIKSNWFRIEDMIPDVKFNFDFWKKTTPRRSTYPACRAVIAARLQGEEYDLKMTKAIQRAYYLEAQNPSDEFVLIQLAAELGLDKILFSQTLNSKEVNKKLQQEISLARDLYVESYPSFVLHKGKHLQAIDINYNSYQPMYEKITNFIQAS